MEKEKAEKRLSVLQVKLGNLFQRVQRLYEFAIKLNEGKNLENFKISYVRLDKTLNEFNDLEMLINEVAFEANPNFQPKFNTAIHDLVDTIESVAMQVFKKEELTAGTSASASNSLLQKIEKSQSIKLKRIEIPFFDGSQDAWPVFYELFKTLVHENEDLSNLEKMQYLTSKLVGSAISICQHVKPTASNYEVTWKALIDRYNDQRGLANSYLRQIFDFKPLRAESREGLVSVLDGFCAPVSAVKQIELPDLEDFLFLNRGLNVLDPVTRRAFETACREKDVPSYKDFVSFIEKQIKTLPPTEKTVVMGTNKIKTTRSQFKPTHSFVVKPLDRKPQANCLFCHQHSHSLLKCSEFLKLSAWRKFHYVKSQGLCMKCLSPDHRLSECVTADSCSKCQSSHHTLLHFDFGDKDRKDQSSSVKQDIRSRSEQTEPASTSFCSINQSSSVSPTDKRASVILSTVVVRVRENLGNTEYLRFLLDSGSQSHFLTSKACRRLNLPITTVKSSVLGFGGSKKYLKGQTTVTIFSRFDFRISFTIKSFVVDKIVDKLPSVPLDISTLEYLDHLQLADDSFHVPGEIDGIIGAELFPYLVGGAKITDTPDRPVAVYTPLGFVMMGKAPTISHSVDTHSFFVLDTPPRIEEIVQKFWEIESVPSSFKSVDELECESLLKSTIQRNISGKYTVALPFKDSPQKLGDSYNMAFRRFMCLERKLNRCVDLRKNYNRVFEDYLEQGHMSLVENQKDRGGYFIPHHAVFKPHSQSTPVRVVFDASAKSSSSISLNDVLFVGPKLQTDIFSLLINFRLFKIVLIADVKQMYRQIWICSEHQTFQKILWRFSPVEPISIFQLKTVVFGVSSSPYLALRIVHQLIEDEKDRFPFAASMLPRDMYMDDLVTSIPSVEEAVKLYTEAKGLFELGGFQLLKWSSNSSKVRQNFEKDDQTPKCKEFEFDNCSFPVLGLRWHPEIDQFDFKLDINDVAGTKRNILSTVARIFDPLGLFSPVILYLKVLIKYLWQENSDWDQLPSRDIQLKWDIFRKEFPLLSTIRIPRFLSIFTVSSQLTLIGFADASMKGYGAVIYLKSETTNCNTSITLVCGKSKVSPTKVQSIPRLELCAALLLSELLDRVVEICRTRKLNPSLKAFTDSTVVLCWLNSPPDRWTTFVANRVAKIQSLVDPQIWAHVNGEQNPADCLSRGLTPQELCTHDLWWKGPSWLAEEEKRWPISCFVRDVNPPEERIKCLVVQIQRKTSWLVPFIYKFSSFYRLLRSFVYVLRFCRILPKTSLIESSDLSEAEMRLCRVVQHLHFSQDIVHLKSMKSCSDKLQRLNPFLQNDIIRVGGRLGNSNLDFNYIHPIILPKKDHFVDLLVRFYHHKNFHCGPHLLLSILRHNYWILSARSVVRRIVRSCNLCFRFNPKFNPPLMGSLPACRVVDTKPFLQTGVDYAGPLQISLGRRRNPIIQKAYISLFVCLATKAVHIELVSSLSTPSFLAAFKRFLSRRGAVTTMYSDCGTNFIGAKHDLDELSKLHASLEFRQTLFNELVEHKIEWKFMPPKGPHFGGLWEINVRSVKRHLFKIVGQNLLTYEEMNTVLVQIEALLNSRPLCPLSEDPSELLTLTPAHFLSLTPLKALPVPNLLHVSNNRLSRYQLLDQLIQSFWKRWKNEYLHELQQRVKWIKSVPSLKVGSVVVVMNDTSPPLHWPLGRVEEVFPGKDGIVRVASIRMRGGVFKRPVVKLCPLPSQ